MSWSRRVPDPRNMVLSFGDLQGVSQRGWVKRQVAGAPPIAAPRWPLGSSRTHRTHDDCACACLWDPCLLQAHLGPFLPPPLIVPQPLPSAPCTASVGGLATLRTSRLGTRGSVLPFLPRRGGQAGGRSAHPSVSWGWLLKRGGRVLIDSCYQLSTHLIGARTPFEPNVVGTLDKIM